MPPKKKTTTSEVAIPSLKLSPTIQKRNVSSPMKRKKNSKLINLQLTNQMKEIQVELIINDENLYNDERRRRRRR